MRPSGLDSLRGLPKCGPGIRSIGSQGCGKNSSRSYGCDSTRMTARYVVRFDDVCPTMNWSVWARIEPVLAKHNVRPLLAVVPDNRDPKLMIEPPRANFWDRV